MTHVLSLDEVASENPPDRLVGRKAASLGRLIALGARVPPGFVVTTEGFRELERTGSLSDDTRDRIALELSRMEVQTGRRFGEGPDPLLVAVRSGAPASMPGMLETVLNVGMGPLAAEGMAAVGQPRRFVLDCERRFLFDFATTVLAVPTARLDAVVEAAKAARGKPRARLAELEENELEQVVREQRAFIGREVGLDVPADARIQLEMAVSAVLRSWHLPRAVRYRRMNGIGDRLGTACIVQAMVFGNRAEGSSAGVFFTRHPTTGERQLTGEYMPRGQGTDVVGGRERPFAIEARGAPPGAEEHTLERRAPRVYDELVSLASTLERALGDVQEVEFAVQEGTVHLLQARPAKRAASAATRIAVDLVREGVVDEAGALRTLDATLFASMLERVLPAESAMAERGHRPIARGLPASPGAASGRLVSSPEEAVRRAARGEDVILVRRDTSPDDVHGVKASVGLLTTAGGLTSHAAVVARALHRPCVAGCSGVHVDEGQRSVAFRGPGTERSVPLGSVVTLDGRAGLVYEGALPADVIPLHPEVETLRAWADARRRLRVYAYAEHVSRAHVALAAGADGIGELFCDSFLRDDDAAASARTLLFAEPEAPEAERAEDVLCVRIGTALRPLLEVLGDRPLSLRLFDDVLPDLLALDEAGIARVARDAGESARDVARRLAAMRPTHKGLGMRGVRLLLVHPHLYRALVRGILAAREEAMRAGAPRPRLELLLPAVTSGRELSASLENLRAWLRQGDGARHGVDMPIGSVIGLPHACLDAREIARLSESLVFDTHQLTQTVFGMSRVDARAYLPRYVHELQVWEGDPFVRFDETGVGTLIRTGASQAREAHPEVRLAIAGEVAGEPSAVALAESHGMDAVTCPVDRLDVARVAAAQAAGAGLRTM